jgi:ribosome-associated protein
MEETPRRFSRLPAADKAARIASWLDEHKARDLIVLDVSAKSSVTDVVIIAGAASVRQGQSLADGILELCRQEQFEFLHLEGQAAGQWILVDLNDVVVHILQEPARALYNLEGLWRDAAVLRGDILSGGLRPPDPPLPRRAEPGRDSRPPVLTPQRDEG